MQGLFPPRISHALLQLRQRWKFFFFNLLFFLITFVRGAFFRTDRYDFDDGPAGFNLARCPKVHSSVS
jgi:hypothetical protein